MKRIKWDKILAILLLIVYMFNFMADTHAAAIEGDIYMPDILAPGANTESTWRGVIINQYAKIEEYNLDGSLRRSAPQTFIASTTDDIFSEPMRASFKKDHFSMIGNNTISKNLGEVRERAITLQDPVKAELVGNVIEAIKNGGKSINDYKYKLTIYYTVTAYMRPCKATREAKYPNSVNFGGVLLPTNGSYKLVTINSIQEASAFAGDVYAGSNTNRLYDLLETESATYLSDKWSVKYIAKMADGTVIGMDPVKYYSKKADATQSETYTKHAWAKIPDGSILKSLTIQTEPVNKDINDAKIGDITKGYDISFKVSSNVIITAVYESPNQIKAVLKTGGPYKQEVPEGTTSATFNVVLSGTESYAYYQGQYANVDFNGVPAKKGINTFKFGLGTNDYGTSTNASISKTITVEFPPIKKEESKTFIYNAKLKVWSKKLSDEKVAINTDEVETPVELVVYCGEKIPDLVVPAPEYESDITFSPNSSFDISGNREGWVNQAEVTVTVNCNHEYEKVVHTTKVIPVGHAYGYTQEYCPHHYSSCYTEVTDPKTKKVSDKLDCSHSCDGYCSSRSASGGASATGQAQFELNAGLNKQLIKGSVSMPGSVRSESSITIKGNGKIAYIEGQSFWKTLWRKYIDPGILPTGGDHDYGYHWTQFEPSISIGCSPTHKGVSDRYFVDDTKPDILTFEANHDTGTWYYDKLSAIMQYKDNLSGIYSPASTYGLYNEIGASTSLQAPGSLEDTSVYTAFVSTDTTGIYTAKAHLEDYASNITEKEKGRYGVDRTKPKLEITNPSYEMNVWTNVPILVTMTGRDEHSGMGTIKYIFDNISNWYHTDIVGQEVRNPQGDNVVFIGGEQKEMIVQKTIDKDGIYRLKADANDAVIYNTETAGRELYKYDATYPNAKITFPEASYVVDPMGNGKRIEYICDKSNKITVEVSDNLSGVSKVEYAITRDTQNPGVWQKLYNINGTDITTTEDMRDKASVDIYFQDNQVWKNLKYGNWYLHLKVTDRAGNVLMVSGNGVQPPPTPTPDTNPSISITQIEEGIRTKTYDSIKVFVNKAGDDEYDDKTVSELKITKVLDIKWQNLIQNIYVQEMAVYNNKVPGKIKLGYRVNFELDTIGFGSHGGDVVTICGRHFIKASDGFKEVDVYIPQDKYGTKYVKATDAEPSKFIQLIRNSGKDSEYFKIKNASIEQYTWSFGYFIRPDAKFVRKDLGAPDVLDISISSQAKYFIDPKINPELLVAFEIYARKVYSNPDAVRVLDYTHKEDQWANASDSTTYGNKKSSNTNIINKGINHGEVFWYDIQNTVIDDLNKKTN